MNTVLENFKVNILVDSTYVNIQNSNLLSVAVNYKSKLILKLSNLRMKQII